MADPASSAFIDPAIFERLQNKIDEDAKVRDELKEIVQKLEKQGRVCQSILSRAHSTPRTQLEDAILLPIGEPMAGQMQTLQELSAVASRHPYYKWNSMWAREVQSLVSSILFAHWLSTGSLQPIEDVGKTLNVPINVTTTDAFHLPIEDYLLAVIYLIEELARLATNSVTLADYTTPMRISKFVKDVHAGFQLLNLKNDVLRRRADGVKWNVKKVEDVVYDLSLRGLVGQGDGTAEA